MSAIPRPALPFDVAGIRLDGPGPKTRQLVAQLRQRLLQGLLPAGARLPATRDLALALGVSRNTVVRAFEHLLDEGLITSRVGDGSYVTPPLAQMPPPPPQALPLTAAEVPRTPRWTALQPFTPSRTPDGPVRAFRWGSPAMDLFPAALWSRLQSRVWRRHDPADLAYGDPAGLPALREWLADYLRSARGLHCSAEQILITGGAQQGIALAAMALLAPGDEAATESPGYRSAAAALGLQAARVHHVPVDAEGLRPAALQALGPRCRLLYVTPSHQFPTGVAMSLQRRLDLLAWARAQQAWVLEDDYDSEYRHLGLPLAPLASLDPAGRTLYVGSLSKLMFPGLRLGYLVAPPGWLPTLARLRSVLDRHSASIDQQVLASFIAEGHFLRHVRRMRRAARERRDALLEAWARQVEPLGLPLPAPEAGLHAYLPLPDATLEQRLTDAATQAGLEVGAMRRVGGLPACSARAGLVLGFAAVPPPELTQAVARLAQAWRPVLA